VEHDFSQGRTATAERFAGRYRNDAIDPISSRRELDGTIHGGIGQA
jgi:hypothetical protein